MNESTNKKVIFKNIYQVLITMAVIVLGIFITYFVIGGIVVFSVFYGIINLLKFFR